MRRRDAFGVLAVVAVAVGGCGGNGDVGGSPLTTGTAAPWASSASAELADTLEQLLSPTPVCPHPPQVRPFPGADPDAMLEMLGLASVPVSRCAEGQGSG